MKLLLCIAHANPYQLFHITHVLKHTIPSAANIRKHTISMIKFSTLQLNSKSSKWFYSNQVVQDLHQNRMSEGNRFNNRLSLPNPC